MGFGFLLRLFTCIFFLAVFLYSYVEKENQLTELRLDIPKLQKELRAIEEGNVNYLYVIKEFESPANLMELAQKPEFSHLKYPHLDDVIILPEAQIIFKKKENTNEK